MRHVIYSALALALVLWMVNAASARSQQYYNPQLPSPEARYPICAPQIDRNKPRICTANPDLPHTRLECPGNVCPEDRPEAYSELESSALEQICPKGSCLGRYFIRNDDPTDAQCIYRIVPSGFESTDPDIRRFDIQLSELSAERNINLHAPNLERRFQLQAEDQKRVRVERGFRIYPFRGRCRW